VRSGLREIVRFLCQHRLVDCIVSTGGGIEEDFIKCLGPTKIGAFWSECSCARTRLMNSR
jgi:deoxyhypusine synthase